MLALVGSGEYLPPMEPVDRELISRLDGPAQVVCLPTAAGREGPERIAYWSELGIDYFTRLGAGVEALPVIDRASANNAAHADAVARANFVYLSGGKPGYLYAALTGTLVWEAILSVLDAGGVLAGCSAGAMVMGETFFGFPGWQKGFSLLPHVTVMPHYDQIPESRIRSIHTAVQDGVVLIGIEGDTALVHYGGECEVLGSGCVALWDATGQTRYACGPLPGNLLGQ